MIFLKGDKPGQFHPIQFNWSFTGESNNMIYSQKEIDEARFFELNANVGRQLISSVAYHLSNQFANAGQSTEKTKFSDHFSPLFY